MVVEQPARYLQIRDGYGVVKGYWPIPKNTEGFYIPTLLAIELYKSLPDATTEPQVAASMPAGAIALGDINELSLDEIANQGNITAREIVTGGYESKFEVVTSFLGMACIYVNPVTGRQRIAMLDGEKFIATIEKQLSDRAAKGYRGNIDGVTQDCKTVWGWAYDERNSVSRLKIDIHLDDEYFVTVSAGGKRDDVPGANGLAGWDVSIPESILKGERIKVSAFFSGTNIELASSPIYTNGCGSPPAQPDTWVIGDILRKIPAPARKVTGTKIDPVNAIGEGSGTTAVGYLVYDDGSFEKTTGVWDVNDDAVTVDRSGNLSVATDDVAGNSRYFTLGFTAQGFHSTTRVQILDNTCTRGPGLTTYVFPNRITLAGASSPTLFTSLAQVDVLVGKKFDGTQPGSFVNAPTGQILGPPAINKPVFAGTSGSCAKLPDGITYMLDSDLGNTLKKIIEIREGVIVNMLDQTYVTPVNNPPTLVNPIADRSLSEAVLHEIPLPDNEFSDPGDTLTIGVSLGSGSALPAGITYDKPGKRILVDLRGTTLPDATYTIRVRATDSASQVVDDEFTIKINRAAPVNNGPVVTTPIGTLAATEGQAFSHNLNPATHFSDPESDPLTYKILFDAGSGYTGALPDWASYSAGTLTGTPPVTSVQTDYRFRIIASDGVSGKSAQDDFTLRAAARKLIDKVVIWIRGPHSPGSDYYDVLFLYRATLPAGVQLEDCWDEVWLETDDAPQFAPGSLVSNPDMLPDGYKDYTVYMSYFGTRAFLTQGPTQHLRIRQAGSTSLLLDLTFPVAGLTVGSVQTIYTAP